MNPNKDGTQKHNTTLTHFDIELGYWETERELSHIVLPSHNKHFGEQWRPGISWCATGLLAYHHCCS